MSRLDDLVTEVFDEEADSLGDETPFTDCSSWDSLKHAELVVGIENRFGVDLSADEIRRLTTKRAVRALLAARGVND